jgi:tetrapyrrole methylase family protein/MazG family protein
MFGGTPMITIVGLGVGNHITPELRALLHAAPRLVVRTSQHPLFQEWSGTLEACDDIISDPAAVATIVARVLADEVGDTVYAVPGHPRLGDATVAALLQHAPQRCRVLPAPYPLDTWASVLPHPVGASVQFCDALLFVPPVRVGDAWSTFHAAHAYPAMTFPFPIQPHADAWVTNVATPQLLAVVQAQLVHAYAADTEVHWLSADLQVTSCLLSALTATVQTPGTLYVPALDPLRNTHTSAGIEYVVQRLLGPAGCPWDHEQTPQSLRRTLLEETYEAIDAIDRGDDADLLEELGDVLLNILMQAEMARQSGRFRMSDVYAQVTAKFIRRHPHVFGDVDARDSETVLNNWYAIKQAEKRTAQPRSPLAGVPLALPALVATSALINKSKRYGMQVSTDETAPPTMQELGTQLFALAVHAAQHDLDAEAALREINAQYRQRVDSLFARDGHLKGQTQWLWRDTDPQQST